MKRLIYLGVYLLIMGVAMNSYGQEKLEKATFAGGCFWCMESAFQEIKGVKEVISGYIGGEGENPTYHDYAAKGYIEAVQISYDPAIRTYKELLDIFWHQIDPFDAGGQFCDRGHAYISSIFYHTPQQQQLAQESKDALQSSAQLEGTIITQIVPVTTFYPAEEYHQDYYKKNAFKYRLYRLGCGRDRRLKEVWGNFSQHNESMNDMSRYKRPAQEEIKKELTAMQYKVTQKNGTEPPFNNAYWDNKQQGIYVDVVSGEPLFSSLDKYKSGTGWPSFTKPLEQDNIVEKEDRSWFSVRTEVRSKHADSHLGHVFNDGPAPTGLRYCMNSAALRFVPKEDLKKEGYGEYLSLFEEK